MTVLRSSLTDIRRAIGNFPPLESHVPGHGIDVAEMYFPKSHAAALDPDRSLVIGNRGMGKSFWASALVQDDARKSIVDYLPESRLNRFVSALLKLKALWVLVVMNWLHLLVRATPQNKFSALSLYLISPSVLK